MTNHFNWGHRIAAVYAAFAVSTVAFVVFSFTQPVELVSADYYARSLAHDQHREAVTRTAALATGVSVTVAGDGGSVRLGVPADAARDATGHVRLYRPARAADDRTWDLALDGSGYQSLATASLPRGHWTLQIAWTAKAVEYYAEERIVLP